MTVDPQFPHLRSPADAHRINGDGAAPTQQQAATSVLRSDSDVVGPAARTRIAVVTLAAILVTGLVTSPASAHDPGSEEEPTELDAAAQEEATASVAGQTAETAVEDQPVASDDGEPTDGAASEGAEQPPPDTTAAGADADADEGADGDDGAVQGSEDGTDAESTEPSDDPSTDGEAIDGEAGDDQSTDGEATDGEAGEDETTDGEDTDGETAEDETTDNEDSEEAAEDSDPVETVIDEEGNPVITFPVVGPVNFVDTWGACRGTGCSRGHRGVDIFAHKLAPLVAAADGVISGDRRSATGISGNTLVVTSDDGWRYLYIHLNNDAPGTDDGSNPQGWIVSNRLRVGDRVTAGEVIGYVGDSGNAERTPSHVHFEIHRPGEGAINPTPAVQLAQDGGRVITVSSLASTPEGRAEYAPTIAAWYRALLKREPTSEELFAWTDRFDIGFATTDDLIADLTMAKPRRDAAGTIVRAFEVALKRRPSLNEIRQWEDAYRAGADLDAITRTLIESEPFRSRHGELTDEEFVQVIYRNAIGVDPSPERLEDWLALLSEGSPRETLTTYWADSYSVKNSTWHSLEVIQSFRAGLDRMPTDEEHAQWVGHLDGGGLIPDVVDAIRTG